jgi:hypothetical protein
MKLFSKLIAGAAFLALASCETSQQADEVKSFTLEETETALKLFSNFCLSTLPNFLGANNQAGKLGLSPMKSPGAGAEVYSMPGEKTLLTMVYERNGTKACGIAFAGSTDINSVSQMFLRQARAKTGGKPKEILATSYFEFARHLNNGSVFTHEVKRKRGQTRHIFLISPPVPKSEVAKLIYN